MTLRHGCLKRAAARVVCLIVCFISLTISFPIFSQSLEDLESEVLGGSKTSPQNRSTPPPPVVEEESLKSSNKINVEPQEETNNADDDSNAPPVGSKGTSKEADSKVYKDVD